MSLSNKRKKSIVLLGVMLALLALLLPLTVAADEEFSCGDPYTPIYEIQGDGYESPFHSWPQTVIITEGIVTVDLQESSELSGFFIQDKKGDKDSDTSDGLFVYHGDSWSPSFDPSVGDLVRVEGEIDEQWGLTRMENLSAGIVCDTGVDLAATNVFARDFTANAESYEGMYVRFPRPLAVTDTYNLHTFGEVWLAEKGVVEQPTNEYPVGDDAEDLAFDNMDRSVLLDDSSNNTYDEIEIVPYTNKEGTLRLGDTVNPLVGAVSYGFGNYRIMTQDPAAVKFVTTSGRPGDPNTKGNLVIDSFNVLN
jgi:predicted extracellular nuclease